MRESILSVGIDIGTSTTQLMFSRLTIENLSSGYMVPRIEIVDKEIIYCSNIYFTPLLSGVEINGDAVQSIIAGEYEQAGVSPADVITGAVIITGETARKKNAGIVLDKLSSFGGEFVVATAGPDLESVLSGRGAGTDKLSQKLHTRMVNLDIGGGTTNLSVFNDGQLSAVSCMDIGGRLVKLTDGRIGYIYPQLRNVALQHQLDIQTGDIADKTVLSRLCDIMADILLQAVNYQDREAGFSSLLTNAGKALPAEYSFDGITFSGGVADFIYNTDEPEDIFKFGDIGILLGQAVRRRFSPLKLFPAAETIRATVVGAGMHTTEVSGSTIVYDKSLLPLKNVPILKLSDKVEHSPEKICEILKRSLPLYKSSDAVMAPVAIALGGYEYKRFQDIQLLADVIAESTKLLRESNQPLIIVLEADIAKALGNALQLRLGRQNIICIDCISTAADDYIDIGEPIAAEQVLPVVIKTIIFNS